MAKPTALHLALVGLGVLGSFGIWLGSVAMPPLQFSTRDRHPAWHGSTYAAAQLCRGSFYHYVHYSGGIGHAYPDPVPWGAAVDAARSLRPDRHHPG